MGGRVFASGVGNFSFIHVLLLKSSAAIQPDDAYDQFMALPTISKAINLTGK